MRKYKYVAVNLERKKFSGVFLAENEKDLAVQLAKQNLYLISAKVASDRQKSKFFSLSGSVTADDLNTFCRQFAIMINSGMNILETLDILKKQNYSPFFKDIIDSISEDVRGGIMLSDAINKHKNIFPQFFRSMVYVGEISGRIDIVLNNLADYYENDAEIKKRTKGAMIYPLMLLTLTIGIVILMMVFVIPTFKDALSELEIEMPKLTLIIYDASDYLIVNWKNLLIRISIVIGVVVLFSMTKIGKYFWDTMKIKLPLVKTVQMAKLSSRFARGFGLLLSSGLDVVEAMEVITIVLGNSNVEKRFRLATEDIRHGMSLSMAFENYKLFPSMLIQMISIGEKTNSVDEVLLRSSKFFDEQAQRSLNALTQTLQTVLLLIMGAVVGVLFIAIYSPMLSIMETINKK